MCMPKASGVSEAAGNRGPVAKRTLQGTNNTARRLLSKLILTPTIVECFRSVQDLLDSNGHGSHTAGTLLGSPYGDDAVRSHHCDHCCIAALHDPSAASLLRPTPPRHPYASLLCLAPLPHSSAPPLRLTPLPRSSASLLCSPHSSAFLLCLTALSRFPASFLCVAPLPPFPPSCPASSLFLAPLPRLPAPSLRLFSLHRSSAASLPCLVSLPHPSAVAPLPHSLPQWLRPLE